ncbi:MAG: two-component system, OmpR family, operon response regulator KdpE [Sphingomonadales bacterium]|jgi:two-component system KDP operon response regulator KdpE|nr:two-component system, OmpR family, operon response regulator KdpE [Sphingomonadales bacterium]
MNPLAPKLLVVDDEAPIRRLIRTALERGGYRVVEAATAQEALNAIGIDRPDLVLLDLGLPDRDGLEIIPQLKKAGAAVIIVSAREATAPKVAALDLGADDYVTKPFDTEEMLARIRAALRRRLAEETPSPVVEFGEVTIDLGLRQVRRAGEEVHLTPREYAFVAELAKHPGRVLTHANLLRAVWGLGHEGDVEYLRVAARAVRRKLEADPSAPMLIRNEPGVGYRLMAG